MDPREERSGPAVTIVVTTHNESSLVEECISSIRAQSSGDWECVVMDDASADDTVDAAVGAIDGDRRFRLFVSDRPAGVSAQRNAGAAAARSPLVTFVDGDDVLFPEAVASRLPGVMASDHPALGGVFCHTVEVGEDGRWEGRMKRRRRPRITWFKGLSVEVSPFIASAPVIRLDAFRAVGGFRTLEIAEDFDLWHRMLRRGFFFDGVREVGVGYRQRMSSRRRDSALLNARFVADRIRAASTPMAPGERVGPFVFREPFHEYLPRMVFVHRALRAVAFAAAGDVDTADELRAIHQGFEGHMEWTLDLPALLPVMAGRSVLAVDEAARGRRRSEVERLLVDALGPVLDDARVSAAAWMSSQPEFPLDVGSVERSSVV